MFFKQIWQLQDHNRKKAGYFWDHNRQNARLEKTVHPCLSTEVRNAIVGDFRPLELRNDIGGLWENFLGSERLKRNAYHSFYGNTYFWQTVKQQEVDYIEDYDGQLHAYEFKWNAGKNARLPAPFLQAYPGSPFQVINPENYQAFLAP
ncbi:MAG: DUF4143 domain-containing protein [Saprospiraceae bacterium]